MMFDNKNSIANHSSIARVYSNLRQFIETES